eukprot:11218368-Lingulodinium_polyedra.AAC.1
MPLFTIVGGATVALFSKDSFKTALFSSGVYICRNHLFWMALQFVAMVGVGAIHEQFGEDNINQIFTEGAICFPSTVEFAVQDPAKLDCLVYTGPFEQ